MRITIRNAKVSDARSLIEHANTVAGESDHLTFGPGEFDFTEEKQIAFLEGLKKSPNAVYFVAIQSGKIVGALNFQGGRRPRVRHEGTFGLSVLKKCWGMGIGSKLLSRLIAWAPKHGISKINLKVHVDNPRALFLYLRHGFEFEGKILRDLKIKSKYIDSYAMGLCL